jgi:hypothetical protein
VIDTSLKFSVFVGLKIAQHTNENSIKVNRIERIGEMNQLATISPSYAQSTDEAPEPTKPAPISAPIIVCVPEMGTANPTEIKMKVAEAMEALNIICSCSCAGYVSKSGMILIASLSASPVLKKHAPINSHEAPRQSSHFKGSAFDP